MTAAAAILVEGLVTRFGAQLVHDGIGFEVPPGQLVALIGGSGTGKSVMLREMVGLLRPTAGRLELLGIDVWRADETMLAAVRTRFGFLFQDGALFSSLSVAENVGVPLAEHTSMPAGMIDRLVALKLDLVGLPPGAGPKLPSQLSGGMRKRAALARALALEPELLFLDEPTSGLDPIGAREFDRLVRTLCDCLGLTVFMVTHDLDTLVSIVDRVIALDKGKIVADGPVATVAEVDHPWIRAYFSARRGS